MEPTPDALQNALQVADWRLRVFAIYAQVRQLSAADPAAAHALWRAQRDELFATHPSSPLPQGATFTGLRVADYEPRWRFEVPVHPVRERRRIAVETGTDGTVPFELIGTVRIPDVGQLELWRLTSYAGGLFLPVRDGSAGRAGGTYGGGRYLLDTVKGADLGRTEGRLILDFNFAYNPSCAYDPAWACPLPQAGNTVAAPIPVGELAFDEAGLRINQAVRGKEQE